jgi:hypothetical protein
MSGQTEKSTRAACNKFQTFLQKFETDSSSFLPIVDGWNELALLQSKCNFCALRMLSKYRKQLVIFIVPWASKKLCKTLKNGFVIPKELRYPPVEYRKIILINSILVILALLQNIK